MDAKPQSLPADLLDNHVPEFSDPRDAFLWIQLQADRQMISDHSWNPDNWPLESFGLGLGWQARKEAEHPIDIAFR